jgi:uncharacterized protein with PIN domain
MADENRPLEDEKLSQVSGGCVETTNADGTVLSEIYYCPDCGAQLAVVDVEKVAVSHNMSPAPDRKYTVTECQCAVCGKSWLPNQLKGNPNTYWHLITKSF